jgi:beta-1,4-mannosyl-glycoprotein beta-1,4-N-acetylglucosaminyltransferase
MYNGEEDILDIRLNTLDPIVDKFIIVESNISHSLLPRELEYPKQKDRFYKFKDKIHYYQGHYCKDKNFTFNDWNGRELIAEILIKEHGLKTTYKVIHGDLDEIPRPELLEKIILSDVVLEKPYVFINDSRQLCFDLRSEDPFFGSILIKGEHLTKDRLFWLRQVRLNNTINGIDHKDKFIFVENGGWHFSYCAGLDRTVDKFKFFCHANEMNDCIKDKEGLINCIKNRTSFDPAKTPLFQVNFNQERMPRYILNNPELFKENLSFYYE